MAAQFEAFSGDELLLRGAALVQVVELVELGLAVAVRDVSAPSHVVALVETMRRQAAKARVQLDGARLAMVRAPALEPDDEIGTGEAAGLLGLNDRQVRRLAQRLGGRQLPDRSWVLSRRAVLEEAGLRAG